MDTSFLLEDPILDTGNYFLAQLSTHLQIIPKLFFILHFLGYSIIVIIHAAPESSYFIIDISMWSAYVRILHVRSTMGMWVESSQRGGALHARMWGPGRELSRGRWGQPGAPHFAS